MDTILFDLDGTLLPMDTALFEQLYFHSITTYAQSHIEKELLLNTIFKATHAMIKNDHPTLTNETVFINTFKDTMTPDLFNTLYPHLIQYYDDCFIEVKPSTSISQSMIDAVKILKDKGYQMVVATNPLFPKHAIMKRIEWASLNPNDFSYITTFENSHFCKPNPNYYKEILDTIKKEAISCLMVGNNSYEDMIASTIGMQTYLVTDCLLDDHGKAIDATYEGNYEDFKQFVIDLPCL